MLIRVFGIGGFRTTKTKRKSGDQYAGLALRRL